MSLFLLFNLRNLLYLILNWAEISMLRASFCTISLCQVEGYNWYLDEPDRRYSEDDPTSLYRIQKDDLGEKYLAAGPRLYTIIARVNGGGGSIAPDGTIAVKQGGSREFTIVPEEGYRISDVKINDTSIGPQSSYTFENVQGDQTIEAVFAVSSPGSNVPSSYTITAGKTENGSVSVRPSRASYGRMVTVTVEAEEGYELDTLTVTDWNGREGELTRASGTRYTFTMPRG